MTIDNNQQKNIYEKAIFSQNTNYIIKNGINKEQSSCY